MIFLLAIVLMVGLVYAETAPASTWSLAHFTSYLTAVVRRNLPLGSSLSAYAQDLPGWRFGKRRVLLEIADMVDNGRSFADALDRYPAVFPSYYRSLVRAGESGGNLEGVLERLVETARLDSHEARRAAGYSLYPAVLATVAYLMMALMFVVVVPKFQAMFEEMEDLVSDTESWILMALRARTLAGIAFRVFAGIALVAFVGPVIWRRLGAAMPEAARAWSWMVWHVPLVSKYERRRAVSQYAVAAGRLMEAGVPAHQALSIVAAASGNSHFDRMARDAAARVAEGEKLSRALCAADRRGELPSEFLWYVEVGEASNKLPGALVKASESAAARSRSALSRLVGLVFPAGIIFIAVIVGMMGYAMFGSLVLLLEGTL